MRLSRANAVGHMKVPAGGGRVGLFRGNLLTELTNQFFVHREDRNPLAGEESRGLGTAAQH